MGKLGIGDENRAVGSDGKVHLVGNVMVDTLVRHRGCAEMSDVLSTLGLEPRRYALITLHHPSNVDEAVPFSSILDALEVITADIPVIFPIHPRSRENLGRLGLSAWVDGTARLRLVEPLGYFDFLKLMAEAAVVLTDSGGIQEETTVLGVPCLTLRENTERPITITQGTNRLTGSSAEGILAAYRDVRNNPPRAGAGPDLWDGHAAERIVRCLKTAT